MRVSSAFLRYAPSVLVQGFWCNFHHIPERETRRGRKVGVAGTTYSEQLALPVLRTIFAHLRERGVGQTRG